MPTTPKGAPPAAAPTIRAIPANRPGRLITVLCAWLIPGGGHLLQGQTQKALVFGVVLIGMFAIGLASSGRLFPFDSSEPLVILAAAGEWMLGVPRLAAVLGGWGRGVVTAIGFEYGNTFLIAAGLLNVLVILDAYDWATGRRTASAPKAAA